ncbi:hypothetical protein NL676_030516 [Syzygium grande]|nr:hypothetical protein NL676_030516 [Syzygium grande]
MMMHRHCHRHPFWDLCLCYVIATTLIQIQASTVSGGDNTSDLNCSSTIQCGNLQNVSYPFWGLNRASYCGLPDFELTCQDGTTALITISNQTYRVLRVDETSQTMTVARTDYWNNICPTYLINTTQEITSPFSYTSDTLASNLTLYYRCQASPSQITSLIVDSQFNCTINGTNVIGNFLTKKVSDITSYTGANLTSIINYFGGCDVSVVLAVNQSAIQEIESNQTNMTVASAINQGFGLQWTADAKCNGCLASGGECGRQTSSGDFICYCQYTSNSSTCRYVNLF